MGETEIELDYWKTQDQLTAAVTGGTEFVAGPLTTGAVFANNGTDIRLGSVSAWAVMGLVTSDDSVRQICDLAGKEVHVALRSSALDYTTQLVLAEYGLTESVQITYIDPLNGPEQFVAGQVSNLVTAEPQTSILLGMVPKSRNLVGFGAEWKSITQSDLPLPTAGNFVNGSFADENPQTVRTFLDEYSDAAMWVAENQDEAGRLAQEKLGVPAEAISAAIPNIAWEPMKAAEATPAVEQYYRELFERWPKSIGGAMPTPDFYLK